MNIGIFKNSKELEPGDKEQALRQVGLKCNVIVGGLQWQLDAEDIMAGERLGFDTGRLVQKGIKELPGVVWCPIEKLVVGE